MINTPTVTPTAPTVTPAKHPAKFSAEIIATVRTLLAELLPAPAAILDPMAGVGGVHVFREDGYETWGIELEPEWAEQSPWTLHGDSTDAASVLHGYNASAEAFNIERAPTMFDAIVTSPAYANRMADQYLGSDREKCRACKGRGRWVTDLEGQPAPTTCGHCNGTGHAKSKRNTYAFALGRKLSPNSGAALQWTGAQGNKYRKLHSDIYRSVDTLIKPGGLVFLNVSDHIRKGVVQPVSQWHFNAWRNLDYTPVRMVPINTPRNREGANSDLRVEHEWVFVLRKAAS